MKVTQRALRWGFLLTTIALLAKRSSGDPKIKGKGKQNEKQGPKGKGKGKDPWKKAKGGRPYGIDDGPRQWNNKNLDVGVCGIMCESKPVDTIEFKKCLVAAFGDRDFGVSKPPTLVWPDSSWYGTARQTVLGPERYPAAVVYAESAEDVSKATSCAYENGYRVSARGRGHSFQGWGVADGTLAIDMTRTCKPDEFVIDKDASGPHLLKDSRYIAKVTAQAGCTNAVMLSAAHKHFEPSEGAMVLIGSCASVGITGYTLGGGMGDITPYTGYAADLVTEMNVVLYDGTQVTVSEDENPELFWASRGGGGGNGIVTSLTYKVVESPASPENRRFTRVLLRYGDMTAEQKIEVISSLQKYMYSDPNRSGKFGGYGRAAPLGIEIAFVFLGPWNEAILHLEDAGLLKDEFFVGSGVSTLWTQYDQVCKGETCSVLGLPILGVEMLEYLSYGETMARVVCESFLLGPLWTATTGDFCADLGVPSEMCVRVDSFQFPRCDFQEVLEAILSVSGDPESFINTPGPGGPFSQGLNGLLVPELESATWEELFEHEGLTINHFGHGAPSLVRQQDTAFPWRDAGILTSSVSPDTVGIIVRDKAFKGNPEKLQGYYNYMSPEIPNWRRFYFGPSWERMTFVKGMYDPHNVFGKPVTAETPLVPVSVV